MNRLEFLKSALGAIAAPFLLLGKKPKPTMGNRLVSDEYVPMSMQDEVNKLLALAKEPAAPIDFDKIYAKMKEAEALPWGAL